jgi:hypothetical protein
MLLQNALAECRDGFVEITGLKLNAVSQQQ